MCSSEEVLHEFMEWTSRLLYVNWSQWSEISLYIMYKFVYAFLGLKKRSTWLFISAELVTEIFKVISLGQIDKY